MAEFRELIPREDEDVLFENREELIRQIIPADIINSLLQRRVIDLDDFNRIKLEVTREGRGAGVEKLLYILHRSGVDGLDKFIESLKSAKYPGLANILQESRQRIRRAEQENEENLAINRSEITEKGAAAESTTNDTRCIILLGKSGVSTSSFGDYLLGAKKFNTNLFDKGKCQIEHTDKMVVVDTPGISSNVQSDKDVANEIMKTKKQNNLLINVYILVLRANSKESDAEEVLVFLKRVFGENVINNMIIVFTGKDSLEDDEFQFPGSLPQVPYFVLDCEHRKQEKVEEIQKEIFSQKYSKPL